MSKYLQSPTKDIYKYNNNTNESKACYIYIFYIISIP